MGPARGCIVVYCFVRYCEPGKHHGRMVLWCAGKSSIKAPDDAPEEGAVVPECQELQNALLQVCFALDSVRSSRLSRQ